MYARLLCVLAVAVCVNAQALLSQRMCLALDEIIDKPTTLSGKSPRHVQKVAKLAKKLFHGLKLDLAIDNAVAQLSDKKKLFFNTKVVTKVVHDTVPSGPQTVINGPQFNNDHIGQQSNTYNYNKLRAEKKKLGLLIGIETSDERDNRQININNYYGPDGGRVNGQQFDHSQIAQQENIFNYYNNKFRSLANTLALSAPVKKLSMQVPNKQKDEAFKMLAYVASKETLKEATVKPPNNLVNEEEHNTPPVALSGGATGGYQQSKKMCMYTPDINYFCVAQMKGL